LSYAVVENVHMWEQGLADERELTGGDSGSQPKVRKRRDHADGLKSSRCRHGGHKADAAESGAAPLVEATSTEPATTVSTQARAQRRTWAAFPAEISDLDGTLCPSCGGSIRLLAALTE
jgi:hypothetical protein